MVSRLLERVEEVEQKERTRNCGGEGRRRNVGRLGFPDGSKAGRGPNRFSGR